MNLEHFNVESQRLRRTQNHCFKNGPDQPVQPGIESQSGPVKTPKIGQKMKNRARTGVEPKILKKRFDDQFGFLKPCSKHTNITCNFVHGVTRDPRILIHGVGV